jgi:hypothetical protein
VSPLEKRRRVAPAEPSERGQYREPHREDVSWRHGPGVDEVLQRVAAAVLDALQYFGITGLLAAVGEPDALGGLTGGEVVGQVKKSVVRRFPFPPQEHKFSAGGTACDPDTDKQWSVCNMGDARGTIDLKMGSTYSGPWPAALVEAGRCITAGCGARKLSLWM